MSAAPNQNNAAQADTKDIRESFELSYATDADDPACAADLFHFTNGWRACVMSQVRAPVANERAEGTLKQVYDAFGIGALARNPSTLMTCLGNVIRRAHCLSQIERVLSVPTPPEPEDDGIWGEESLLRWGADEKGYADHFKVALAEWTRRAALASAPVAKEAQPAAYLTLDEEGSPCMLFFDVVEARSYCALGEVPEPLFRHAAPQASAEARPNNDAVDLARAGMALHAPGAPEHTVCAELVRMADVLKQPQGKPPTEDGDAHG